MFWYFLLCLEIEQIEKILTEISKFESSIKKIIKTSQKISIIFFLVSIFLVSYVEKIQ